MAVPSSPSGLAADTARRYRPRIGEGTFRALVTDACDRRYAVTQEKAPPALEAAHLRPFSVEASHHVRNGLVLRSDVHGLFDSGYITVTPEYPV